MEKLRPRPFVIALRTYDKLHLVFLSEEGKIGRQISMGLPAVRAFKVHDPMDAWIDLADIVGTTGLDEYGVTLIAKSLE